MQREDPQAWFKRIDKAFHDQVLRILVRERDDAGSAIAHLIKRPRINDALGVGEVNDAFKS